MSNRDDTLKQAKEKAKKRASLSYAGASDTQEDVSSSMDYTGAPTGETIAHRINRTETAVQSEAGSLYQRRAAAVTCHHVMCAMMVYTQLMLFGALRTLAVTGPASWWVTALQTLPALGLYFLMYGLLRLHPGCGLWVALERSLGKIGASICGIIYAVLLWWDGQTILYALNNLMNAYLLPEANYWVLSITAAITCAVCVWSGGRYGVSRMFFFLRWLVMGVLVACLAVAMTMGDKSNLFPFLGESLATDLKEALALTGATWPVVLLGFVPMEVPGKSAWPHQKPKGLNYLLLACLLATLLFFTYNFVLPAEIFQKSLSWGEHMALFLRSSPSKVAWVLFLMNKLLLLLMVLAACANLGAGLLQNAISKKPPMTVYGIILLACMIPIPSLHSQPGQALLEALSPFRLPIAVLPLLAGYVGTMIQRVSGKEAAL